MSRWRTRGQMLVAGVALALVSGASGKGCSGSGSGDTDCPKIEAAGALSLVAAAVLLPAGDLEDDIKRAREIAQRVADARDGSCGRSRSGVGYKVVIPLKEDLIIEVRVMARGSQDNYYRVIVPGKDAYDKDGNKSNNPKKTHIDIDDDPDDTVDNILDIIDKIKDRET